MDPSELLQALRTLHAQFTSFKSSSTQKRTRLQQQLNLARDLNRALAIEVRDLTRDLQALKQQVVEQASRKDELNVVRSLQADFGGFQQTWESEDVKERMRDEDERLRALELDMLTRESGRKALRATALTRRTLEIAPSIEQPVLNRVEETPVIPNTGITLNLWIHRMALRSGAANGNRAPRIAISTCTTIQELLELVAKTQPAVSMHPRRLWKVTKSALESNPESVQTLFYPISRLRSDNAVIFGETERGRDLTLMEDSWGEGDGILVETKVGVRWPSDAPITHY